MFGPPGCTTIRSVQQLAVVRNVHTTVVMPFGLTRLSAGAFSGRPAII